MSLADAALRRGFPHPVTLVFSARTSDDDVAVGLMRWWEEIHPNFKLVLTHTRTENHDAGEMTGRITERLGEICPDLGGTSVFIAGSPEFVADCERVAKSLGASDDLIYTEGHISQLVDS
jgi:CDP-4-dehydro-6-deoxyglucose reductase